MQGGRRRRRPAHNTLLARALACCSCPGKCTDRSQCGPSQRYDLLNDLYKACGQWEKALEVAQKHDRIHLRTTNYQYAKHLESLGDFRRAIKHYEAAQVHRFEVPRMLFDAQRINDLEVRPAAQLPDTQLPRRSCRARLAPPQATCPPATEVAALYRCSRCRRT